MVCCYANTVMGLWLIDIQSHMFQNQSLPPWFYICLHKLCPVPKKAHSRNRWSVSCDLCRQIKDSARCASCTTLYAINRPWSVVQLL